MSVLITEGADCIFSNTCAVSFLDIVVVDNYSNSSE